MNPRILTRLSSRRGLQLSSGLRNYVNPAVFAMPPVARFSTDSPSPFRSSFWTSLIPKPFRRSENAFATRRKPKSKDWNPATFYICIFLLIGSMSIQMIALRHEFATYSRRSEARIRLLNEVIGKVQAGEDVDVEGLLGTGDPEKEEEWEQIIREIEEESAAYESEDQLSRAKQPREPQHSQQSSEAKPVQVKTSNAPSGFY